MTINDIDISTFKATLGDDLKIVPATVTYYDDWLRQSLNPIIYDKKETYKDITFSLMIEADNENEAQTIISQIATQLKQCTIKFDEIDKYFDCKITSCTPTRITTTGIIKLDVELQSSYAYTPVIDTTWTPTSGVAHEIDVTGNLPTPAVLKITPTQDIGTLNITGLSRAKDGTDKTITINNLHANAPVVIDGENMLITEPDIETILTSTTGANKWIFRKYNMVGFANPDDSDIHELPTKDTIPDGQPYTQQLITDTSNLVHNIGYDYLGYLKTAVNVSSAKSVTLHFYHDDGASVYLNGTQIYGHNYHMVAEDGTGAATVTLNLNAGWNTIEFIWIQHYGPDGVYGITPVLNTAVDALNCKYATPDNPNGIVNKFSDAIIWIFPQLQPGKNNITVDSNVVSLELQYKNKFM